MKNVNTLLFFTFLFIAQISFGQVHPDVIINLDKRYLYKKEMYTKHDLGKILKRNGDALYLYKKFENANKVGNVCGSGTVVIAILGIWGYKQIQKSEGCIYHGNNDICWTKPFAMLAISAGVTFGSISIVSLVRAKKKLNQSIHTFNQEIEKINTLGNNYLKLDFGTTNNGLGLVLNF